MVYLKKVLSLILTISFTIVTILPKGVTATNIIDNFQTEQNNVLNVIKNIPNQYGKFCETNIKLNEKPNVILIYDMHCQPYTQKNIYSIIGYIHSHLDIDKIFIEGAYNDKINVSSIKDIDLTTSKNILDKMLSKGCLSGTEYFSYLSDKDNLYGIEDFNLYIQTIKQYKEFIPFQKEYLYNINKAENNLNKFKKNNYTADMEFFEKLFFQDIKHSTENLKNINSFLIKNNIDLSLQYPNIYKYLKIKEYEQINNKNINRDIQSLVDICKSKLPFNIYINLINSIKNKPVENQLVQLYFGVKQFLSKEEILEYNYIEKINSKNILISSFDIQSFFQEKKELYFNLAEQLFNTSLLKEIITTKRILFLLKKYVQLKIVSQDIEYLFTNFNEIKKGLTESKLIKDNQKLADILNNENLFYYYQNHTIRNKIFVENIINKINKNSINIVVVGGFHKKIQNILNNRNIKYISIFPNAVKYDNTIYNKIISDIAISQNCLADCPLVLGMSKFKQEEFLVFWIQDLKRKNFNNKEIITVINSWAKKHNEFFGATNEKEEQEIDVTNTVIKNDKFSIKGWLLKAKDILRKDLSKFKAVFKYKYNGNNLQNLDLKTIKKMQSNIKYFPFIQFMLGFDLYSSFSTVFMQSNGYSLPTISLVMSLLAPISFAVSGIGGFIGDKISKRTLIIISIVIHTLGTMSFALSGFSPVLLVVSQILPVIGISLLSLTLSPFLYKSLDNLGEKESFKEIYGSNLSLFWIIMSVSSLLGGLLASLTSQLTVILVAVIPDIIISIGALIFTHNENISKDTATSKQTVNKEKKNTKDFISNLFAPVKKLSSNKRVLSLVIFNIIVNNMFFVILCFFLQPALIKTGISVELLAPVYFIGNLMQSLASHLISKVSFIVENKNIRTMTFVAVAGLFSLFAITGHPIFLALVYALMNFWQGTSSLIEITAVHKTLDDNMKSKWLGFKSMLGMIIATITQISISGLLAMEISNNVIITGVVGIVTGASFIIPKIIDRDKKKENMLNKDIKIDFYQIKGLLSCA